MGHPILESGETADIPEISVNARIAEALARADRALAAATAQFKSENWELAAAELAQSASALGETTGKTVSPDLLDQVFHRFCLGK